MYEDLVKRLRNRANGTFEEKCEGCEFTEDFPPCAHCTIKAFNDAADAIEELQAGEKKFLRNISGLEMENENLKRARRWIPVAERLPEKFKDVLTYGKYGIMIDKYIGQFCGEDSFALALRNTTHWMPLPEPPQEETE